MDEQQWIHRIDKHLEATDDHMRRGNEIMARSNEVMAGNERAFLDLQSYLREATVMLGTMAAEVRASTQAFIASQRDIRKEMRDIREEMREEMRDIREEMRAGRAALFALIDRFEGGAGPSSA